MRAYQVKISLVEDVAKKMAEIQKKMSATNTTLDKMQQTLDNLPGAAKGYGEETDKNTTKTKGLLKQVHSMNRLLRRTTGLVGAAFGIGQISQFTNELINAEQSVANTFNLSGSALTETTAQAQKLATVYGTDFNDTLLAAKTLSEQFGISSANSFKMLQDAMSKGVGKDFVADIQSLAPAFKAAGLSADSALATIINADRLGVKNSLVSAYQEGINNLRTLDGRGVEDALAVFKIDINELRKNLDSGKMTIGDAINQIMSRYKAMGDKSVEAASALKGLFGDGALEAQQFIAQLAQAPPGLADIANRTTEATKAQQTLFAAWADFKQFIAGNVAPALVQIVDWVKQNQASLLYWGSTILTVTGYVGALWGVFKLFTGTKALIMGISGAFAFLNTIIPSATLAQTALNVAMYANPIGKVVAGIAALGVGVYALISYWDQVVGFLGWASNMLWNLNPLSWMIHFMDKIFPGFKSAVKGIYDWITGWFGKAFDWIGKKVNGLLQWLGLVRKETNKTTESIAAASDSVTGGRALDMFKDVKKMMGTSAVQNVDATKAFGVDFQGGFGGGNYGPGKGSPSLGIFDTPDNKKGGNVGLSAGIAGVQGDGSQAKNLTINIAKLMDGDIVIQTTNMGESASKIKDIVMKALLEAVNDANAAI